VVTRPEQAEEVATAEVDPPSYMNAQTAVDEAREIAAERGCDGLILRRPPRAYRTTRRSHRGEPVMGYHASCIKFVH
jgi:ATP-dependent DNA ligase